MIKVGYNIKMEKSISFHLLVLLLLGLFGLISCQNVTTVIVPNCTNFNPLNQEVCNIEDLTYTLPQQNQTLYIEYNGTIVFRNVTLNCADDCDIIQPDTQQVQTVKRWQRPDQCCSLVVNSTSGNVTFVGRTDLVTTWYTVIKMSSIEIYANQTLSLSQASMLDSSGMGYMEGPGFVGLTNGGCYAAQSGYCGESVGPSLNYTYSNYFALPNATDRNLSQQFGSGAGTNLSMGGGRIVLNARSFSLSGNISANGMPTVANASDNILYGGSGGYIYLNLLDQDQNAQGRVSIFQLRAEGGKAQNSGGSGGRIIIDTDQSLFNSTTQTVGRISAVGGGFSTVSSSACQFGGPGTIFYRNESKLVVNGSSFQGQQNLGPKTLISGADPRQADFQNLSMLSINNYAAATFRTYNLSEGVSHGVVNWIIVSGYSMLSSSLDSNQSLIINVTTFDLRSNSQLTNQKTRTNLTHIQADSINTESSTSILAGQFLNLVASHILIQGQVSTGQTQLVGFEETSQSSLSKQSLVVVMTSTFFYLDQSTTQQLSFQTDRLFIYSQGEIYIQGKINSVNQINTCSNTEDNEVFSFIQSKYQMPLREKDLLNNYQAQFGNSNNNITMWDLQAGVISNFTYTMIALGNLTISNDSVIQTSKFGAYSDKIEVDGIIDTSGRGCLVGQGIGRGRAGNQNCTGAGGSNGGKGGRASNITLNQERMGVLQASNPSYCSSYQSEPYGKYDAFNVLEGSGGGSTGTSPVQGQGNGGGIVWLQARTLSMLSCQILADGTTSADSSGVGGGAGGSIMVGVDQLSGDCIFSAQGGSTGTTGAGAGSGGRLKLYLFSWFDQSAYPKMTQYVSNKTIATVAGGTGLTPDQAGQNGTIWSSPCAPGYTGTFCKPCRNGTYKTEFSNIDCKLCENMPPDAQYSAFYSESGYNLPMCPYECKANITEFQQNPKCLSSMDLFFDNMGGLSVFVLIIIATVFAIGAFIYFLYTRKKKESSLDNDENLHKMRLAFEELDFIQRDLHQHICRIYLVGNNEIHQPWVMPANPPVQIRNRVHLDRYREFTAKINSSDKRSKSEKIISHLLPFLYPALKPLYGKRKRKEHYYSFKSAFIAEADKIDFWKNYEDSVNIELRFTSSDDFTLGYVDFLDTKRTRDTYDKPPLPMTILVSGTGSFAKPFHINRHDPLIRSISYYCDDTKMWDMFLANLNSTLQALCLQNYGFLVRWRLKKVLDYIEIYSRNLFERKGMKLNLWLLEAKNLQRHQRGDNYGVGGVDHDFQDQIFVERSDQEEDYYILSQEFLKIKKDVMQKLIEYWCTESFYNPQKVFKLALVITQIDPMNPNVTYSPAVNPRLGSQFTATERNSQELPRNRVEESPSRGRQYQQQTQQQVQHQSINWYRTEPTNNQTPSPSNNLDTYDSYIQLLIGSIREIHVDKQRVKVFKNYVRGKFVSNAGYGDGDDNSDSDNQTCSQFCELTQYYMKQAVMLIFATIKTIALRQSGVVKNFIYAAVLYMIFVVIDITLTTTFVVSNLFLTSTSKTQMVLYFVFYPLASVISPILGILSVMLCKAFFYRAMAYMNALSLFTNTLSYILAELIINGFSVNSQRLGYIWVILTAKLVLAQLLSLQIAYFRNPSFHVYKEKLNDMILMAEKEDHGDSHIPGQRRVPQTSGGRNGGVGGDLGVIMENPTFEENYSPAQGRAPQRMYGGAGQRGGGTTSNNGGRMTSGVTGSYGTRQGSGSHLNYLASPKQARYQNESALMSDDSDDY